MFSDLRSALRPAIMLTVLFAMLLGIAYPLALTAIGQALFPAQANGSLIRENNRVIGSALIGQAFLSDRYFHGRPSTAGENGYDASASAGSNLGPASKVLAQRVGSDAKTLSASTPDRPVPPDLVTTSASGLDPHVSPDAALYQVDRIATARGLSAERVRALVTRQTERPLLGFLGEPRVNVLALNRALDRTVALAEDSRGFAPSASDAKSLRPIFPEIRTRPGKSEHDPKMLFFRIFGNRASLNP